MSGRFRKLELDVEARQSLQTEVGTPTRDHHFYLAQAIEAHRGGRFERGLQYYTRCLEDERSVVAAWVGQVQMLVQLGEHEEAQLWSDKALELFRQNPDLLAAKAQSCARLGNSRAAYVCSDASLQSPGSSAWRWSVRGEVVLASGRDQESVVKRAETCFRKALCETDADWHDRLSIGRVYLYHGRSSNAFSYLKQAVTDQPDSSFAWFELGGCQRKLGLREEARKSLAHCLELDGYHDEAREALAALSSFGWKDRLMGIFRRETV